MIYIAYSILVIFFAYFGDRRRGGGILLRLIPLLMLIVIIGFRRYNVGVDSANYMDLYNVIPYENYRWIEIGFDWLIRTLDSLGFDYNGLFLSCIIMTSIPIFLTLEKTKYYFPSAVLIYILTLTTLSNGIRQCISVGMFFYGATFIKDKKIIPFAICMAGSLLFHYSSIILFPLFFIWDKRLSNTTYIIIYAVSFIFCFVDIIPIIKPLSMLMSTLGRNYYENFDSYVRGELSIFGFLYNTAIYISLFYLMIRSNAFQKYSVLANSSLVVFVLKNMSINMPIVGRVSLYFAWFPYLLLPYMAYELYGKKNGKTVLVLFFFVYMIGFVHQILGNEMKMLPYEFNFVLWR